MLSTLSSVTNVKKKTIRRRDRECVPRTNEWPSFGYQTLTPGETGGKTFQFQGPLPERSLFLRKRYIGSGHLSQSERKPLDPDSPNAGPRRIESRIVGFYITLDTITRLWRGFVLLCILFQTTQEVSHPWDEGSLINSHSTL